MYRNREYAAAINTIKERGIELKEEKDIVLEINKISAPKFIDGGAAILQAAKQNHQNVREGNKFMSPLVINMLREDIVS